MKLSSRCLYADLAEIEIRVLAQLKMPKVWNKYHPGVPPDAEYCGRGSPYGNPYVIGVDGERDEVCDLFEKNILPTLDVSALRGKDLVCFCKPKRCHCDSILLKANAF